MRNAIKPEWDGVGTRCCGGAVRQSRADLSPGLGRPASLAAGEQPCRPLNGAARQGSPWSKPARAGCGPCLRWTLRLAEILNGFPPSGQGPPLPAPLPLDEQQIAEQRADDHVHDIPSSYLGKRAWQRARLFCFLLRCVHAGDVATAAMIWQAKKSPQRPSNNYSPH